MENIVSDIHGLVQENIMLKEAKGMSAEDTTKLRGRIQNNLF